MQENNQKDPLTTGTANEPVAAPQVEVTPIVATVVNEEEKSDDFPITTNSSSVGKKSLSATTKYALAGVAVLVIVGASLFMLERQGRIETGLFSAWSKMQSSKPVAKVNGVEIARADYDSSLQQLLKMAATQGVDTSDAEVVSQYETQAMDTLVNGELLRQSALKEGMEASPEAIEARFAEITAGVGGAEQLAVRMAEFGISEKTLRRDIENEILIQGLFDGVVGTEVTEVTDEEVKTLYDELGGEEAGLPPLAEVREQVVEQIRLDRQQKIVGEYIEKLRTEAEIEILI